MKIIEHHYNYFVVGCSIRDLQINTEDIQQYDFVSGIATGKVGMCLVLFLAQMSESGFTRLEDFQDALGGVLLLQDSQSSIFQSLNLGNPDSEDVLKWVVYSHRNEWFTLNGMRI